MSWLLPEASANALETDALLGALVLISLAVLALVFGLLFLYVVRYRGSNGRPRHTFAEKSTRIEIAWTAATLVAFFGLFLWGANLYVRLYTPAPNPMIVNVIGKQWMWKAEHQGGQREINALHIPAQRAVQLVMTSEDVIHDFAIPAFRIKHDVLPGRYENLSFTATAPGTYHLFCTQFCGTDHAAMGGDIVVLEPAAFEQWLADTPTNGGQVAEGRALFIAHGCSGCHQVGPPGSVGSGRAPSMARLYGTEVPLADGTTVIADERWLHDSITMPATHMVAGYPPVMPPYAGQISEEDIVRIVAFIKSLAAGPS